MPELEERLYDLGRHLDYPQGANLAAAVSRRLRAPASSAAPGGTVSVPPRLGWPRLGWPRLALAAAAIAVVVLAALVAFPSSREAVASFFGLKGVIVQRVPSPPPSASPTAVPLNQRLHLGSEVTLAQARAMVSYPVLVPQALGDPDLVYLLDPRSRQAVALVYLPRPDLPESAQTGVGLLLIEFPGKLQRDFMEKMLGPDATLEQLRVNGQPGYWISGAPHALVYLDPNGEIVEDTYRLAGNTLVWNQGSLLLRIEANLSRDQALGLAASLK